MTKSKSTKEFAELKELMAWFEEQDELDLESTVLKAKRAMELIGSLKESVTEAENQLREITEKVEDEE